MTRILSTSPFKRRSSRQFIPILFLIVASLFIMTGCETVRVTPTPFDSTALTETETIPATTETVVSGTVEPTPVATTSGDQSLFESGDTLTPKEIRIWLPPQFDPALPDPAGKTLKALLTEFTAENPEFTVDVRVKDTVGDASGINMLSLAASAAPNAIPQLIILDRNDMITAVQKGLIFPIETDLFADSDSWYSYARESAAVDNVLYGIPIAGDPTVLTYRPARTGPEMNNWEEILTRGLPIAFEPTKADDLFGTFIYLAQNGKTKDESGAPTLDQEILTGTLNFFLNGGQKGAFPPALAQENAQSQIWQQFIDGTFHIIVNKFSQYRNNSRADITAIPLPRTEENSPYPLVNTWNVVLTTKNPETMEAAIKLAESMAQPEFNDRWTQLAGYMPVRSVEHTAWETDPSYDHVKLMSRYGALIPSSTTLNKLVPILNSAVSKVILTTTSPETAAKEALDLLKGK